MLDLIYQHQIPVVKAIYLLLFPAITFCSCSDEISVIGKVYDESTQKEIPNRKIIIQGLQETDGRFRTLYTDVVYADSTGTFLYNIEKRRDIWMYDVAFVGDSAYSFASHRLGMTELRGQGQFLKFYLNPLADLTITINRNNKLAFTDTLYVSWECDGIDGRKLYPYKIENYVVNDGGNTRNIEFRWIGGDVQSAIKTKVIAEKRTIVHWELFRRGEDKRFSDTIICRRDKMNYSSFIY